MSTSISSRIKSDLQESQIDKRIFILILPLAFFTYLFHEFGHWLFGELTGNEMTLNLNSSGPVSGAFLKTSDALWSAIGGPLFTILQALIGLLLVWKTKSVLAYAVAFMAVFSRFYSIVFGSMILMQDETRIADMMGISQFLVSGFVLAILFFILWRCHKFLQLDWKALGYFVVLGVFSVLVVIGVNEFLVLSF